MTEIGIRNLRINGELGIVIPLNQTVTVPLTADPLAYNAEFFDITVVGKIQVLPVGRLIQVTQESPTAYIEKTEDGKLRGTILPAVDIMAESPQVVRFTLTGDETYQATISVDEGTTTLTGSELFDIFKEQNPGLEDPSGIIGVEFGFVISAHDDCSAAIHVVHEDGSTDIIPWNVEAGEPQIDVTEITAEGQGTMTVYAGSQTVTVSTGEGPVPEPYLNVIPTEFSVPKEGLNDTINIESNVGWEITSSQTWCRVTPNMGSANLEVAVEVQENLTSQQRTARLSVVAGDLIKFVDITQEGQETDPRVQIDELTSEGQGTMTVEAGADDVVVTTEAPEPYLEVDPAEINMESSESEVNFIVTSNVDWEVATSSSWCTPLINAGHGDSLVRIQVEQNESSSREGIVTVSSQGLSRTVTIIQEGAE